MPLSFFESSLRFVLLLVSEVNEVVRTPPSAVRTVDSEEGDGQRGGHGLAGGGAVPGTGGQNSLAGQKHEGVGVGGGLRFDEQRAAGLPWTCEIHVAPQCERNQ